MLQLSPPACSLFRIALILALALGFILFASPAEPNIAPDALLYFHVQPLGAPEELCLSDIDWCGDMHPSTPEQGLLEFQVFIDPQQGIHGELPIPWLGGEWAWPDAWSPVSVAFCNGGDGWFDFTGGNPHVLQAAWPCEFIPDEMFLAMTVVFDVHGYGRLEPVGDPVLVLGCGGDQVVVTPVADFAEAGTECEYSSQPCRAGKWFCCEAEFDGDELAMRGRAGESAHAELGFEVADLCYRCSGLLHVHSDTPWLTGSIEDTANFWEFILVADADLADVPPGAYACELQVEEDSSIARCLPVTVNVDEASAVDEEVSGSSGSPPLTLRLASGNPFTGPFVWSYVNPAPAWVRCEVFDASGRKLAQLLDGEQFAGSHAIFWDAMDAGGRRVPPGVYAIRLSAGGVARSDRVVVVR